MSKPPQELKRSLTEITMNSNIVSLENWNDVNENLFRKSQRHGKLYKGPNWTAYNKENLGSIPRNVEKALVEDKKSMTKVGFTTQTERFYPKNQNMKNNPGPGTYNITGDMDFTRTSSSFYSSKGFGNGFVSASDRFDDCYSYYSKYAPGPGQYKNEVVGTLEQKVANSIFGKSLYNKKKTPSWKVKKTMPGPGYYNPIYATFDQKQKMEKIPDSVFKSSVKRFNKGRDENYPGPGKYFKDEFYVDYNDKGKTPTESYYFRSPEIKKEEPLKKYGVKTDQEKEDAKFKLTEKKGKLFNKANYEGDSLEMMKSGQSQFSMTMKDLYKLRNKTFLQDMNYNSHTKGDVRMNLVVANGGLESDKGMEYIHKILHKPKKPDLFELNSQRWKESEIAFKVPGPAYYNPRLPEKALSFNRNNVDFIVTPGVVNDTYETPIYNN